MQKFNIVDYGAVPNSETDSTPAIMSAIEAAKAAGGGVIYSPEGTYRVGQIPEQYVDFDGISIEGDGMFKSVWVCTASTRRFIGIRNSKDVAIRNMGFDANRSSTYGGIVFYSCSRVTIEDTHYFDSSPLLSVSTDIYSYVFGRTFPLNSDIVVRRNVIEDLQLEIDSSERVCVWGNTLRRPRSTAAIGFFSLQRNAIAQRETAGSDITVRYNTIIDPSKSRTAIAFHLDPPMHTDGTPLNNIDFRGIRILDNEIHHTTASVKNGYSIKLGTTDSSKPTMGIIYDDIEISGNIIRVEPGVEILGTEFIQLMPSRPGSPDFRFTRTTVRDNKLFYSGIKPFIKNYGDNNLVYPL